MGYFDISNRPDKYKSIEERWEWIITYMVLEDRFVHEMLLMMEKRANKAIGTMGVMVENATLILQYNPDFINELTDPELRYVVTHEIYHVALHHCTIRLPENPEDRSLYNIAADMAINTLIPEDSSRHMPKDKKTGEPIGILPNKRGFENKLSMEQYVILLRDQEQTKAKGTGQGSDNGDKSGDKNKEFDNHDGWNESEVMKEIIRNNIDRLSRNEKVWGSMPGDVKAIILAAQRGQVSWQKILRHYLGLLPSTKIESTFKKPHRRYGYPYCGTKRNHIDRKLVAIDTSGSISDDDLSQFLAEVNRLAEIQPVDMQLFDHELQGKVVPFDRKRVKFEVSGRGGTCFEPVMKLAEEKKYQSVIILTDGCAAAPKRPNYVKDVIWVITGDGNPPVEWGTTVHITPKVRA